MMNQLRQSSRSNVFAIVKQTSYVRNNDVMRRFLNLNLYHYIKPFTVWTEFSRIRINMRTY